MGRLLMATEIRSTKTYWHVQAPDTANVSRIYPGTAATAVLCCAEQSRAVLLSYY
jgi:hypothetical protein